MNVIFPIVLAVLSIWDYPARQLDHERLRDRFVTAVREGDTATMLETSEKGVTLLPDDPTWRFNLACSLAYCKDTSKALDALEEAIDLGFRDADKIANDTDLKRLGKERRFGELVEYARAMARRPILTGPMAVTPAVGTFGRPVAIGEQNVIWDFDTGCFDVKMSLLSEGTGGNTGDLYMNRDEGHSQLTVTNWPGLTSVRLDSDGRARKMDVDFPNMLFPYPVFGNASRGFTKGPLWRSIPRALMTIEARRLKAMHRFYLSNQVWVFPAVDDYSFATNKFGDVFMSVAPYWIATQGISWSDQYYLRAALEASRSFRPAVKKELVSRGLLAPTIQMLLRRSLKRVTDEDDYLTDKAHPTCFPPNGLSLARLKEMAAALKVSQIPPVASIVLVAPERLDYKGVLPEATYISPCAWAFVLRADKPERNFLIKVAGGDDYMFKAVHDERGAAYVTRLGHDAAKITIDKTRLTPTNRVDVAVFARQGESSWGAPSFISFAVVDAAAPYSDPLLTESAGSSATDGSK